MKATPQEPVTPAGSHLIPTPVPVSDVSEIELKFLLSEDAFAAAHDLALLGGPKRHAARRLRTVYFDTEQGDLWRTGTVLRMRTERGQHVMTLKAERDDSTNLFARREIEVQSPMPEPDLALFGSEVASELAGLIDDRPLLPQFSTDIRRGVRRVAAGRSQIEVAFDSGFIVTPDSRAPVREIELELRIGTAADLLGLGLALTQLAPVRLGVASKSERGMRTCLGTGPRAVRAERMRIADPSVDDMIGAIIFGCLRQFIGNWPAFESQDAAEAVHQMRVAMRRLRAALALFQREFPCAEFIELRRDAKRIASAMGEARNWDVFADLVRSGPAQAFAHEAGFEMLLRDSDPHRHAGYAMVAALLSSVDTTRFVLSAQAFVARHGWRNTVPGAELPRLSAPATGFAAQSLDRLHRRVHKRGKRLHEMAAEERHELRIDLKNLRYATDFFGGLFGNQSAVQAYARAAARLQDILGVFNDMAMVNELVQRIGPGSDLASARASGLVVGWYSRGAQAELADLRDTWEGFRKVKPFWN